MAYVAKGMKRVYATPSVDAERLTRVGPGLPLSPTGKQQDIGADNWREVFLPDDKTTGWVLLADYEEVADPQPRPLDEEYFVRFCLTAEREINAEATTAPWFVAADFLIARALLESGMSSRVDNPNGPWGPLALTNQEWEKFRASGLTSAAQFASGEHRLLLAQTLACAYAMSLSAKQFSQESTARTNTGDGDDVPSYLDVFVTYLLGAHAAALLANDALDTSQTLSELQIPSEAIASAAERASFSSLRGSTTVSAFLKLAETNLARLLDAAFDRMNTLAKDELPTGEGSVPAWLAIARAELDRPVDEATNPNQIKTYFKTIDYGPVTNPLPHWCGAFVGFCVKTSGGALPSGPARAANWKSWGTKSYPVGASEIPLGAIVVLKPQDPKTSGHVAFFERFSDAQSVELLGGNQDDSVKRKSFKVTQISAVRMQEDSLPIGAGDAFDMTRAGVPAKFQRFGDLIVDRFLRAGFVARHQLVAALANAIRESGLDPEIEATPPEKSYGLFQCNQTNGVGKGYTKAQLKNPEINTSLIIAEARRARAFVSASTLEAAVDAFVRYVERPQKTDKEVTIRLGIAGKLLGIS
jgi:uncharacterized protein (TIGR02594 family)